MTKTIASKIAIMLFSLVFISTNTEGYPASLTNNVKTKSYKTSSLYDLNFFVSNISEPSEEEAKLDAFHQNHIHSSLFSYIPSPIELSSESLSFHLQEPISNIILERQKNRAPPINSI
ncbi:hypothetical protein EHQ68_15360 [Leptospira congkakensis]|uniref:DUF1564 family protein n=1 Tax=Leptospira congkakensis TaxID=2484932 RepID=A0A4Z1AB15_9LEPT|nr:hypothetical protein [Leptospira congkakensis]TGL86674.1 hypothetical protein EHQ68_15360 [Leptospira congkakensis]TGL93781.1 hypothetical protein EHQ69_04670 [Leptospira congkakensis]TGL94813.1 hypothetical protein EHQ70_16125 [Leptospira congkakensis]